MTDPIDKLNPIEKPVKNLVLNPCNECIESLRYKLFKIKSEYGMIPYNEIVQFAKTKLSDLYTGIDSDVILQHIHDFNIEHAIPVHIMAPRNNKKLQKNKKSQIIIKPRDTGIYINNESLSDPHLLFPTIKRINDLRSNHDYGVLASSRDEAMQKGLTLLNRSHEYLNYNKENSNFIKLDEKFDIYIDDPKKCTGDNCIFQPNKEFSGTIAKIVPNKEFSETIAKNVPKKCTSNNCIFQPNKQFSGTIARIVFYYFIMYAYDFTKRPGCNDDSPWYTNIDDDSKKDIKCNGFDIEKWKKFFFNHLSEYYKWATENTISEIEHKRNKTIINLTQIPNIFAGYIDINGVYQKSTNDVINHLLFGHKHNHDIYKNMTFFVTLPSPNPHPPKCIYNKSYTNLKDVSVKSDNKGTTMTCKNRIIQQNKIALEEQKKLYKQSESPVILPSIKSEETNTEIKLSQTPDKSTQNQPKKQPIQTNPETTNNTAPNTQKELNNSDNSPVILLSPTSSQSQPSSTPAKQSQQQPSLPAKTPANQLTQDPQDHRDYFQYPRYNPQYLQNYLKYLRYNPQNYLQYLQHNSQDLQNYLQYIQYDPKYHQNYSQYLQNNPKYLQYYLQYLQNNPQDLQNYLQYIQYNPQDLQNYLQNIQYNPQYPPHPPQPLFYNQHRGGDNLVNNIDYHKKYLKYKKKYVRLLNLQ